MNETQVNIPLLRKAVEWAEAEAGKGSMSEWLQTMWETAPSDVGLKGWARSEAKVAPECGTTYCIAGYVVHLQGGLREEGAWREEAAEALGITSGESDHLFHASNSIEDVRRIAEDIAGERL